MSSNQQKIQNKINRIKGQVSGVEKMVNECRDVVDIVTQISAIRSALSGVAVDLLKQESNSCFDIQNKEDKLKKFEELVKTFFKAA